MDIRDFEVRDFGGSGSEGTQSRQGPSVNVGAFIIRVGGSLLK